MLSQPTAATAVANNPEKFMPSVLVNAEKSVGGITTCTAKDAQTSTLFVQNQVLLVQNVGALTWANSLEQAIAFTETVNRMCEIILALSKTS